MSELKEKAKINGQVTFIFNDERVRIKAEADVETIIKVPESVAMTILADRVMEEAEKHADELRRECLIDLAEKLGRVK